MSVIGLEHAIGKMRDANVPQRAIDVFAHHYRELVDGATGMIPEDSVAGLTDVARADEVVAE
jgi:UTP--glucose-1-phosphate uridylyltransferase